MTGMLLLGPMTAHTASSGWSYGYTHGMSDHMDGIPRNDHCGFQFSNSCCINCKLGYNAGYFASSRSMLWPSRGRSSQRRGTGHGTTTRSNRREPTPSGVHDPPQLRVVSWPLGPGDGLEVLCLREICLEEPAAAGLLNGEERTTEVQQPPQLRGVLLSRAGYHAEVETRDLVRIKEGAAGDLLYAIQASLHLRQNPALRVVVLGASGHDIESRSGSRAHQGSAGRRPARV